MSLTTMNYAIACASVQFCAVPQKADSKSAEGNLVGVRPPPSRHQSNDTGCSEKQPVFFCVMHKLYTTLANTARLAFRTYCFGICPHSVQEIKFACLFRKAMRSVEFRFIR